MFHVSNKAMNMVTAYAPQNGCSDDQEDRFWRELSDFASAVPRRETVLLGADRSRHVGQKMVATATMIMESETKDEKRYLNLQEHVASFWRIDASRNKMSTSSPLPVETRVELLGSPS